MSNEEDRSGRMRTGERDEATLLLRNVCYAHWVKLKSQSVSEYKLNYMYFEMNSILRIFVLSSEVPHLAKQPPLTILGDERLSTFSLEPYQAE